MTPILLFIATALPAAEETMPGWVLPGILGVESSSYYGPNGVVYMDKRVGASGERGPFQMTHAAFAMVAKPGERFVSMQRDTAFAELCASRYLWHLYDVLGDWDAAVRAYNVGLRGARLGRGYSYLQRVKARGQ